ncbi:MAG: RNA polymerase factor sigma-54 [Prevotella sp.]|nr:RNA polymerase factor sigma-54 [Prevotella sp.]
MSQEQIQIQKQEQLLKQTQTITQQQLLQAQLVELPITQLLERINTEMDDNPALEASTIGDAPDGQDYQDTSEVLDATDDMGGYDNERDREDRQSALDAALESIGRDDDELPVYHNNGSQEDREEMVFGSTVSFYDQLNQQVGELELTDRERYIVEYLIGSLDDDGLLRKPLDTICEDLAIWHNIDATTDEVEHLLHRLQEFDPAGIGARSLQECLLLQIRRREPSRLRDLMEQVITHQFDDFTHKHWDKIQLALSLNDLQAETLIGELRKLNPKPGASMGESIGRSMQQITPDFIVDTQDDGTVTFQLNHGDVPELHISQSFADTQHEYQNNREHMSRQMKEALLYTKKKVAAAQGFIEAVRTRQRTLSLTMQAIIQLQHRFFEDGDESSLRPMILKDVSQRTGLDLSTISRVCSSKYAQTRWGTFPLRYFFSDGYTTQSGEELSTREIKVTLRDLVEAEDKQHPLSDDALRELLHQRGYPIARRTVAKYREQLGIPIARLRK